MQMRLGRLGLLLPIGQGFFHGCQFQDALAPPQPQFCQLRLPFRHLAAQAAGTVRLLGQFPSNLLQRFLAVGLVGLQHRLFTVIAVERILQTINGTAQGIRVLVLLPQFLTQRLRRFIQGFQSFMSLLQLVGCGGVVVPRLAGRLPQSCQLSQPQSRLLFFQRLPQFQIHPGLLRLPAQRIQLQLQLRDFIANPQQIILGTRQTAFRFLLAVAVLGNARCFLKNLPAVGALDRQDLINAALADIGVALPAQACVHQQLVDVPQTGRLPVDVVLTLTAAVIPARDHDLRRVHPQGPVAIIQQQRRFGKAHLGPLGCAAEDDILHFSAPETAGTLLAQDPTDSIGDVGLAAAVGAHNGGDIVAELHNSLVGEGLEALHLQRF